MRTLIKGGTVVNQGRKFEGSIVVEGKDIVEISRTQHPEASYDRVIDASGCYVLPGIIDDHVHFREPGLTAKADIESESRAAAAGGVTSFFDMPNTIPQTTTLEALADKFQRAAESSHVNYSFFFGATNDNYKLFHQLDKHRIPGIKLFMGSSTGNMLVDRRESLEQVFRRAHLPIMAHCEDTALINSNLKREREQAKTGVKVWRHPYIRSAEACERSTELAVKLASQYGRRLHVAHVTTARELDFFKPATRSLPLITAEVVIGHLLFSQQDYRTKLGRIKVNPAIKGNSDRQALRRALSDGRIAVVGTDHAPHLFSQKRGGYDREASGMPMIQFSLPTMLELVDQRVLTIERLVQLMCHNPARLFQVRNRGYLREGYRADIVIVRPESPWTVTKNVIESKCQWSPVEGHTYRWRVEQTLCNGHLVYSHGHVDRDYIGEEIQFR